MEHRFGIAALIGKPNVGKSTLLNQLVGQKVSIVSNKPQTTRRRLLGILTREDAQIVFIDTPGIHEPHTTLGKAMVDAAKQALGNIDMVLYVADASKPPSKEDHEIANFLKAAGIGAERKVPVLLVMNKMDLLKPEFVVEHTDTYMKLVEANDSMLTTATKGHNVPKLLERVVELMPEGPAMYPEDEFTDQSSRFLVAEIVREKILYGTRQEVPHATAVLIAEWDDSQSHVIHISADIVVEREGQKAILIGRGGSFLKDVGIRARKEIEEMLDQRVYLELFVKVRPDWRMNPRLIQELNYGD